jgi:hypothetical protein
MAATTAEREKPENCATAWFAALERARMTGNLSLETRAKRELLRLGVVVQFSDEDASK